MIEAGRDKTFAEIDEYCSTDSADYHSMATEGKYASAHDLRRSFGTRWAARVKPATLQLLMRHRSIETTMKYYVDQDSDDVADELWATHKAAQNGAAK